MMFDKKEEKDRYIIGNYECAIQLTTARTCKITGVIYSDDTPAAVNERLDFAQDVLDRQFVRADVFNKEAQLTALYETLRQIREQGAALVEKRDELAKQNLRLSTQERDQVNNFDANVRNMRGQIESAEAAIRAGKSKLNGAAPPV